MRGLQTARRGALAVACALSLCGCLNGRRELSAEERAKLAAYVASEVPASAKRLEANFDNKLHVVAVSVEPGGRVAPGDTVKVRAYWRCDERPGDGWLLFTHVRDERSGRFENLDWVGPLRENRGGRHAMGPADWEPGKIYIDEQSFTVPSWDGMGDELKVVMGTWKNKSDAHLRVLAGESDGGDGVVVANIPLRRGGAPRAPQNPLPELHAAKLPAGVRLQIDGKADEPAWASAPSTGRFVDVVSGGPNERLALNGSARVLWDDEALYVLYDVQQGDVRGGFRSAAEQPGKYTVSGQPKLWTGHTVELMIDPDPSGDNRDYYEIQVNPQNLVFRTQYDSYNTPATQPDGPFGHEDWDAQLQHAVTVRGSLDDGSDIDEGYTVELALPWRALTKAQKAPPAAGDVWRMNFYAMSHNSGVAWSPILGQGNFHRASRFGRVVFKLPAAP